MTIEPVTVHTTPGLFTRDPDVLRDTLIALRVDRGISQSEVARRMGVTQATICHFENRRGYDVRLSTLQRYAAAISAIVEVRIGPREGQP